MARVWNLSDVFGETTVLLVGGVEVAPGSSVEVSAAKIRGLSLRYPKRAYHVGPTLPARYREAKAAPPPVPEPAPEPPPEPPKETKKSSKKKKKKKPPKEESGDES